MNDVLLLLLLATTESCCAYMSKGSDFTLEKSLKNPSASLSQHLKAPGLPELKPYNCFCNDKQKASELPELKPCNCFCNNEQKSKVNLQSGVTGKEVCLQRVGKAEAYWCNNKILVRPPNYIFEHRRSSKTPAKIKVNYKVNDQRLPEKIKVERGDLVITPSPVKIEPDVINIHPPAFKHNSPVIDVPGEVIKVPQQKVSVGTVKIASPPPIVKMREGQKLYDMGEIKIPAQVIKIPKPIISYEEHDTRSQERIKIPPARVNVHLPEIDVPPQVVRVKPPTFYVEQKQKPCHVLANSLAERDEYCKHECEDEGVSVVQNISLNLPTQYGNGYGHSYHQGQSSEVGEYQENASGSISQYQSSLGQGSTSYNAERLPETSARVSRRFPGVPSPVYINPYQVLYPTRYDDLTATHDSRPQTNSAAEASAASVGEFSTTLEDKSATAILSKGTDTKESLITINILPQETEEVSTLEGGHAVKAEEKQSSQLCNKKERVDSVEASQKSKTAQLIKVSA